MNHSPLRRSLLLAAMAAPVFGASTSLPAKEVLTDHTQAFAPQLAALEIAANGRLGMSALKVAPDATSSVLLQYRADERFPLCSTFKLLAASAILKHAMQDKGVLQQRVTYTQEDLVTYSPITEKHVADGMTVAELCAAALQYSDNTAANMLIKLLGGPAKITKFARSIGDESFRLDRWETELNTSIPGDLRDTTTPAAMAHSLQRLALGENILALTQRTQLQDWLKGNTTGATRIRAGVPASWTVGDKTGTGDYGTTNDVAVLWPSAGAPIVVTIYFTQQKKEASARNDVIATVAKLLVDALGSSTSNQKIHG